MDMNNYTSGESHVAQQSRHEKFRIQHLDDRDETVHHQQHNLEQSPAINARNVNLHYGSSDQLVNLTSTNCNLLSAQREAAAEAQHNNNLRPIMGGGDLFTILPNNPAVASSSSHFQGLDTQAIAEWMVISNNQNAMVGGEILSSLNSNKKYVRPVNNYNNFNYNEYQENPSSDHQKLLGDMNYATAVSPSTTTPQDVTLACVGTHQGLEAAAASILQHQNNARNVETGHATLTDHERASAFRHTGMSNWTNRPAATATGTGHQWSNTHQWRMRNVTSDNSATRGLSLSLSSNPQSDGTCIGPLMEGFESQDLLHSKPDLRAGKSNFSGSSPKPSIIRRGCQKLGCQDVGTGTSSYNVHRNITGPLGPFTGYATILKNSRFLKPAQDLLDEFCGVKKWKHAKKGSVSERFSIDESSATEADAVDVADREVGSKGHSSTSHVSSPALNSSKQINFKGGVSSGESYRPEYQDMRTKLLYLQEEVSKRYKLYHQQLQMVVSSFESVAGLSGATPYVSLAFKSISKNFRCMKSAIMNQLKHVAKALGEEMRFSAIGTSSTSKGTVTSTSSRLNCLDQILQKHKSGGANVGFPEPQQHVWRPQRGLPERAVAVLRAWLFEHFLHPYPTDTDKHMLASQTGLSRNQVSNWFINARVRLWKPMVEEIHMLETQGVVAPNQTLNTKSDTQSPNKGAAGSSYNGDQQLYKKLEISAMSGEQLDFSGIGSSRCNNEERNDPEPWNQDKRSRVESHHQCTTSMDRSLMDFIPYQRSANEFGGLDAVSLTLGLRHGVESSHRQQEDQLRRQYGGHMIHDFVG